MSAVPAPTWGEFKDDLRRSAAAWRTAPLLPLVSVGLTLLTYAAPGTWWWVSLPVTYLWLGWLGTERIWYLRIFRDKSLIRGEAWRFVRAFAWRYTRLGLLGAVIYLPIVFLVAAPLPEAGSKEAENAFLQTDVLVVTTVMTLLVDFILTFVTPALAFSTRRVRTAFRIGIRILRDQWPRSAWYAFVPPLAVIILLRVFRPEVLGEPAQTSLGVAATLLNVWFKGATAAFYLRQIPVGNDGSAFDPKTSRRSRGERRIVDTSTALGIREEGGEQPDPMQQFYRRTDGGR